MGLETTMPVTPYSMGMGNCGGMFGGQNEWIVFLIIAMMFGWGGNGFGGRGFGGVTGGEVLADQFALNDLKSGQRHIDDGIRGLERGVCDLGYLTQNQGSQTREAVTSGVYGVTNAITNLGSKLDNCCCNNLRAVDSVKYDMSQGFCNVINANAMNTRDILESNCKNTQRILDTLNQNENQRLRDQNNALTLQLSQTAQTASIVSALRPVPIPSYIVNSPYESIINPTSYGYGFNGGCGCNGNC